ncbi:hypothetical protein BD779DRAFT_1490166 [Infundibulicybe gibba]|nr:hypothetical protein BD779DRAFT_1490166 [Infundibulicybe gibba]
MLVLCARRYPATAVIRSPVLAARYSQPSGIKEVANLVNELGGEASKNDLPPMSGPQGYAVPEANPFTQENIRNHLQAKPRYRLHCHSTSNNTIATFTHPDGRPIAWFSGGSCGFKKGNRASYEAGYQCAVRMFKTIEDHVQKQPMEVDLFFKGFGQGRDALHRALMTSEGERVRPLVSTITDRTPIKIGGTRAKKTRRL